MNKKLLITAIVVVAAIYGGIYIKNRGQIRPEEFFSKVEYIAAVELNFRNDGNCGISKDTLVLIHRDYIKAKGISLDEAGIKEASETMFKNMPAAQDRYGWDSEETICATAKAFADEIL